jgi:D-amino-acid dehydrogenase
MKHYAVIGAGITGVTSAYALARRGHAVTLIEKHPYAAMETSYANGGQLSASNAEVWNSPATLLKGLKWMFRPDAPLLMHPAPGWHKLSWLTEFVWAMRRYGENTAATARLAIEARRHLFAWAETEGIDFDLRREGILHVYRDRADFEHAGRVSALLARGGLERRAVTPAEMRALEPTLHGEFYGGYYTESDSTGDIHKFTTGLAAACERLGVQMRTGCEAVDAAADARGVRLQLRDADGLDAAQFDGLVVCAGLH